MSTDSSAASSKRVDGKVVIITGGASGIGAAAVKLFHQHGAKVVIADIQDDAGQALADKLGSGDDVSYIHCDVSSEDDVISLVDATVSRHGRLDVMYNNAGVLDRGLGSILDTPKSDLDRLIQVNFVGSFLGAKHAARVMVPQKKGCILFTASAAAAIAGTGTTAYAATKHAVVGMVKNLAAELGQYGIRVNCVSPWGVATPMAGVKDGDHQKAAEVEGILSVLGNLKGAVLKAEAVAQAALYLASDEANYLSGVNLVLDGGFSVVNPSLMMVAMKGAAHQ